MIHRDISCGNVYYDSRTGTGRIGDFEFVKRYGEISKGHIKTVRLDLLYLHVKRG